MLELQHISYETEENREILHDISLTIQDRFVAITGPNGGGNPPWPKSLPVSIPPPPAASCWMARTSPPFPSPNAPAGASAMPFSSRCALRAYGSAT